MSARGIGLCGICVLLWAMTGFAQNSDAVRQLEAQRARTLEEIERTNQLLGETTKSAQSSLERLNLITRQIQSREEVIRLLNQEISILDSQTQVASVRITQLNKELNQKKKNYAKSIRGIYRRGAAQDKLLFILSAQSFAQSLRRVRYLREYANWQQREAHDIIKQQAELAHQRDELERKRADKQALLGDRERENANLQAEEAQKKREVGELNKRRRALTAELRDKRKRADALDKQIEKLIAEEIARAEAEAKRKEAERTAGQPTEARVAETTGGYAMTQAERKLSGSFASNRGHLPYPVTGPYAVVGTFGLRQHEDLKYVRTNNSGIDIRATAGADARAVFKGIVTRVFVVPGYNNSIIVRHGNYLTVYSNLSQVYVKAGDEVDTRQAIGRIFSDPDDGGTTLLHFQLWKEKTKLDPQPWLE